MPFPSAEIQKVSTTPYRLVDYANMGHEQPMRRFDPEHNRQILTGDCGYEFDLASDFDQAKGTGGRGSSAHAFLGTAIQCLVVGFVEPALRLLEKAQYWVTSALAECETPKRYLHDERYSPDGEAALRYQTLALCNWLLHNQHDAESFGRFVELEDRHMANSKVGKDKVNVSLLLPTYVDAGSYQKVLQLFTSTPGLSVPKSLDLIRNEGQMSYVLSRHRLNQEYASADVTIAVRKFLDKNVDDWLSNGHFIRVAEWMKIIYWQEGKAGLSAKESLLKCYDHQRNK